MASLVQPWLNAATAPLRFIMNPADRAQVSLRMRQMRAEMSSRKPTPNLLTNDDEQRFPNRAACFTKGLPHSQSGDVNLQSYEMLLAALNSNRAADFDKIPRGSGRRLVNPQAGNAFSLTGEDPQSFNCPPPPALGSVEMAAEMVELYWQALCRDIPFSSYATSELVSRACEELSKMPGYQGPRVNGRVTPAVIFRGPAGSVQGPFVSQFLYKPVPLNSGLTQQLYTVPAGGVEFMTNLSEFQQILDGVPPWRTYFFDDSRRYLRNGRDLAEYVHYDYLVQPFINAAVMLAEYGPEFVFNSINMNLAESNPYKHLKNQVGFVTFGLVTVLDWLGRATSTALKAGWAYKWYVHRRLRPEQAGGRVHNTLALGAPAMVHESLLGSAAVRETFQRFGTYLLPQAYPEGSPLHPAFPSGHAVVAGACATVMKAFYAEDTLIADSVLPNAAGTALEPCEDVLNVGNEIDKLAWNVSVGRDFAGIHYRSDLTAGIALGEQVALSVMRDLAYELPEDFAPLSIRLFNGTYAIISRE